MVLLRFCSSSSSDVIRKPLATKNQSMMIGDPGSSLAVTPAWYSTTWSTKIPRKPSKDGM